MSRFSSKSYYDKFYISDCESISFMDCLIHTMLRHYEFVRSVSVKSFLNAPLLRILQVILAIILYPLVLWLTVYYTHKGMRDLASLSNQNPRDEYFMSITLYGMDKNRFKSSPQRWS